MSDFYEILKGVPLPSRGEKYGLCATLRKMDCGDCIAVSAERRMSIYSCARSVGAKVKTRSNADGTLTVWRTDSPVSVDVNSSDLSIKKSIFE